VERCKNEDELPVGVQLYPNFSLNSVKASGSVRPNIGGISVGVGNKLSECTFGDQD